MRWLIAVAWATVSCAKGTPQPDTCGPNEVCIIAGTGDLGFNGDMLPARETRLASPSAVYEDANERVIIVDYSNMRVRTITDDNTIETVVGNGFHAYSEEGASAIDTPIENPVDIGWDPSGQLCLLPQHEGRVVCIDEDNRVERFAGTGVIADSGDGGAAMDAEMGYGGGMVFTNDGTLFISDSTYSRIRRVQADGTIDTVLGTGTAGTDDDGFGPEMAIRFPERMAFDDATQQLFVADAYNHRIIALDTETLDARIVAGTGESGFSGDGGPALNATLNQPIGVAVGPHGGVLISDSRNHVIRYVDPNGQIDTIIGTGNTAITAQHTGRRTMSVVGPAGLSWTAKGDLLIAEQFGHRILKARGLWNELL